MLNPIKLTPHVGGQHDFATPWTRVSRDGSVLRVTYRVPGDPSAMLLPPTVPPFQTKYAPERRADRLWEHTCFELFVRRPAESGYLEFNFSPSSEWAAYQFDSYRTGMRHAEVPVPGVISTATRSRFELSAQIELNDWVDATWLLNVSAVIEEKDGTKSYWALAHPPEGPPDFHHPACFVLELPPRNAA